MRIYIVTYIRESGEERKMVGWMKEKGMIGQGRRCIERREGERAVVARGRET